MKNLFFQRMTGLIAVVAMLACLFSLLPMRNASGAGAPPTISDILDQNTFEDNSTGAIPFTINDDDILVDLLIVTATSSDQTLVPDANISLGGSGADRTITLVPASNENGSTTITVTVDDGTLTASGSFLLTITAVNDEPSFIMGSNITVSEDSGAYSATWATGISAGPPDEGGQTLTFTTSNDNNSLFSVNPSVAVDGTLFFIPAADANGSATVTLDSLQDDGGTANGGDNTFVPAINTFTITVLLVNDAPLANNDTYGGIDEDSSPVFINPAFGLLNNDTDVDNLPNELLAIKDTDPTNGVLPIFSDNGSFRYKPNPNACGNDSFTYHANDGSLDSNIATVTLSILCINDAPDFTAINPPAVLEDAGSQVVSNWAAFDAGPVDEDATQSVSAYIISNSTCGTLLLSDPSVDTSGTLTYSPVPEEYGSCSFDILVQDDGGIANGGEDTGPIHSYPITIRPVNDQPDFTAIDPPAVDEDSGPQSVPNWATFDAGPSNEDATQSVSAYLISNSTCNTLLSSGPQVNASGTLSYTPASNQFGTCTFDARVKDNGGTANGGINTGPAHNFTITVLPVNDPPTISDIPDQLTQINTGINNLAFTIGDVETPASNLNVTATSSNITLVPDANITLGGSGTNRTIYIVPEPDQYGTTTITVTVEDADGATASDTFILVVNAQPTISDITDQGILEDIPTGDIPFVVNDAETPSVLLTITAASSNTSLVPNTNIILGGGGSNRTIRVVPTPNQYGTATITVRVQDLHGGNASDTFTMTVSPVNDEPDFTASNPPTANEDGGLQTVIGWATDFNPGPNESGQSVLRYIVSNSTCGALLSSGPSVANDGTLTYSTIPDKYGSCSFQLQVQDNGGTANGGDDTSQIKTFTIAINNVNDAPDFTADEPPTVSEDAGPQSIPNWATFDAGPDDEDLTQTVNAYIVSNSTCGILLSAGPTVANNGTLSYTPAPNQNGTCTFQVQVQDSGGTANGGIDLSQKKGFSIAVTSGNDPPVVLNDLIPNSPEDVVYVIPFDLITANDSKGAPNEAGQNLIVTGVISQTGGTVTIDALNRAVVFTPYLNYNGPASFQYKVMDDGFSNGTPDPKSSDGYAYVNFTITPINDPPAFLASNPPAALEDAGKQTVPGWATFDAGPNDEDNTQQVLQYIITSTTCASLLAEGPAVANNGSLIYTPLKDANGTCTFTVRVLDNGNSTPPHPLDVNLSQSKSFIITIREVNDEPTFINAGDITVMEDQGCYTQTSWATDISAGPANEAFQELTWNITSSNPGLFSVKPALDKNGTLKFCTAANKNGAITVRVSLTDNGGTASGGVNTSSIHIFTIIITAVNDPPIAVDDNFSTAVNEPVADNVLNNDYDIDNLITDFYVSTITDPVNGVLSLNPNGSFTYTPNTNYAGKDTFTYFISDGKSQSNVATVTITILPKPGGYLNPWGVANEYRWIKVRSGISTDLDCSETEKGIVLTLRSTDNGLVLNCMPGSLAKLYQLGKADLPGELPARYQFASGFKSEILQANKALKTLSGWTRISFVIPNESRSYTILYWDTEAETWFEIPPATEVTGQGDVFEYDEERKVLIGVQAFKSYRRIEAVINFTGTFILVQK